MVTRRIDEGWLLTVLFMKPGYRHGMGSLQLPIDMPGVTATVAANRDGKPVSWSVKLVFPPPDHRYVPASITLSENDLPVLRRVLEEAQAASERLPAGLVGEFSREIDQVAGLRVALVTLAGQSRVRVTQMSRTGWTFGPTLSQAEVLRWVRMLSDASTRGAQMAAQLASLPG